MVMLMLSLDIMIGVSVELNGYWPRSSRPTTTNTLSRSTGQLWLGN